MNFGLKKNLALLLVGIIPLMTGAFCLWFYNNILFLFVGGLLGVGIAFLLGLMMIKDPVIDALLGKGNIAMYISETGQFTPFIVRPEGGFIRGVGGGERVEGVMDRSLLSYLRRPGKAAMRVDQETKNITLTLNMDEYEKSKFYMGQMGFFMYSAKLKQFITKEMLATLMNETFSKHMITYTAYKTRELNTTLRDFARSYVDLYKEKKNFWEQGWFKIVIIAVIVLIVAYFALPYLLKAIDPAANAVGKTLAAPPTKLK